MARNAKCIFITSAGRTGSRFLANALPSIIPSAASFHEPDILTTNHMEEWPVKCWNFGLLNSTVGKFLGISGLRTLSNKRMRGLIDDRKVINELLKRREKFRQQVREPIYIEANWAFYGVFDLLPQAFPISNSIYIVRDPRTWIQSSLNFGHWYHKRDYIHLFGLGRLNPSMFANDKYKEEWNSFSTFQKLCWAWQKLVSFALERIEKEPRVKCYRYEDLFVSHKRYDTLQEMLAFMTRFPDGTSVNFRIPEGILSTVVHRSEKNFPAWPQWSASECQQVSEMCGPLMKQLGYGEEPEWKAKLSLKRPRELWDLCEAWQRGQDCDKR